MEMARLVYFMSLGKVLLPPHVIRYVMTYASLKASVRWLGYTPSSISR